MVIMQENRNFIDQALDELAAQAIGCNIYRFAEVKIDVYAKFMLSYVVQVAQKNQCIVIYCFVSIGLKWVFQLKLVSFILKMFH